MNSSPTRNSTRTLGAVILAGGLARRMGGVDKGLIKVAGKPMVQYALECVQPHVSDLVINANRNIEQYSQFGVPVVPDNLAGHQGPLAGLSAAMATMNTDVVLMCPCDSPFIEEELVVALLQSFNQGDHDIAVAHDGERLQPVFCAVRQNAKNSLDSFLLSGERKIDKWFAAHTVHAVNAEAFLNSFVNINTEDERLKAETKVLR